MALVAYVKHQIQTGRLEEAADRINGNGARMAAQPGFLSRDLLIRRDGTEELATVTVWESEQAYDAWVEHNRTANVHAGSDSPYIGAPETTLYVHHETGRGASS